MSDLVDLPAEPPEDAEALRPQTLLLSGADGAWLLNEGKAHVFVTPLAAGRPTTARRFLFTVAAPAVLFALSDADPALRFEAIVDPGGQTAPVALATLFSCEEPIHYAEATAGADQWIEGWIGGCARLLTSRPPRDMANTDDVVVRTGHVIDGAHGFSWRRVGQGEGALFDLHGVGGGGLSIVPLAPGAWVRSFEDLRLVPLTSRQLYGRDQLTAAVLEAQAALASIAGIALALDRVDEGLRRGRRTAQLASDTRRVVGELGRMVGAEAPVKVEQAANRTLFSAVHLLGERLGVRARPPSAVRQSEAELEPSLDEILRASGLQSRPVRLPRGWQRTSVDDILGFRGAERRPVALIRGRGGRYTIHDAETGEHVPLDAENAASIAEDGHILYQPLPDKPVKLRDLVFFGLQRSWGDFATIAGSALLGATLGSAPAMASKLIFETLIPQHMTGLLLQAGLALTLFALLSAVFVFTGTASLARIRARASSRLKAALWDRVLRQPMPFLQRYTAPDLTMRIATAENVVMAFHTTAHQSITTLGYLIVNIATMVWLAPGVAAVAIGILALLGAGTWFAAWAQKRAFVNGEAAEGSTTTFVHALTNGVRKLRLAGAEERAFVKWADRFTRSRIKLINVRRVTNRFSTFLAGYTLFALAGLFLVISWLSLTPIGVGSFFGFISAFGLAASSLANLGRAMLQLALQLASVPYMQPLLDAVPPLEAKKSNPGKLSGALEVSNLSFAYGHEGGLILQGVSFSAEPGEFVAIVGPTGCGKSTLLKLLLGLEQPVAGAVLYDQLDLASLDLDAVRQQIGVVMQRPQLMPTSIYENLRGVTNIELDGVWEAAKQAGIADDIRAMPMGMHTLVTEGSQTISGGQRQRLAIARALARHPAILLLDEATSALDNGAQASVMENLNALGCTRIVIAHRLSTVQHADKIIVLDGGQIAEVGTYQELMATGGLFARLASSQVAA